MTTKARREYDLVNFSVRLQDVTLKENRLEFFKDGKIYTCSFQKCAFSLKNREGVKAFFVRKFNEFSQYPNAIIHFDIYPADRGIEPLYCVYFYRSSMSKFLLVLKFKLGYFLSPRRLMFSIWKHWAKLVFLLTGNDKQLRSFYDAVFAYHDSKLVELSIIDANDRTANKRGN